MGGTGRALSSSLGAGALVLVLVLLGLGGAVLAGSGAASSHATGASPPITFSLSPAVWAVLFLLPLLVGILSYLLFPALGAGSTTPARVGAGLAIAVVVMVPLLLLLPHVAWGGSSTVTLGGIGGGGGTNDTSVGTTTPGAGNASSGGGSTGTGSGGTAGPGNNSGTGEGSSGSGGGGSSGFGGSSGSGGQGAQGSGSNSSGKSGSGGSTGSGGSGGGGAAASGGGNCSGGGGTVGLGGKDRSGGAGPEGKNNTTATRGAQPARAISLRIPNWIILPLALGLSAAMGILAVPGVLSRLVDRRPPRVASPAATVVPDGAAAPFRDARLAIERGERPREAIVRLYGRILGRVVPNVEDLASSTAEEIERTRFAALHVPSTRSVAITTMFEEARYSTHPIDQPDAERFVDTLRAVEQDIARAGAPR